jgi:ribosomal subunit interface protein
MSLALQITFRGLDPSPALEATVREHVARLERFSDDITRCHVLVEAPHRRHHQGNLFRLRIDLAVPGREIVVGRDPAERQAHEDPYVAIRDAFDAARRQLEDHARVLRAAVKTHVETTHGRVAKLFPEGGYGFIETANGREIYFHRNSILNHDFEKLRIGAAVRFAEESGDRGPQASSVWVHA